VVVPVLQLRRRRRRRMAGVPATLDSSGSAWRCRHRPARRAIRFSAKLHPGPKPERAWWDRRSSSTLAHRRPGLAALQRDSQTS
jgi:hypothetical protein